MRLRPPREWRSAYQAWSAGARMPTRTEARWFYVAWAGIFVTIGGARWWEPIGYVGTPAAFVYVYVLWWRLRSPWAQFTPGWDRDVAERTGWPPRLVLGVVYVLYGLVLASMVASWLR